MVAMATRMAIDELALKLDDTVFALIKTVAVDEGSLAKGRDSRRNGGRPAQLSILARASLMDHGAGQSAPASTHARMMRPNSACDPGAGVRPAPGDHAQPTSVSSDTWCSKRRHIAVTIAGAVFDLRADLAEGPALPCYGNGRKMPLRMARHMGRIEVRRPMARVALEGRSSCGGDLRRCAFFAPTTPSKQILPFSMGRQDTKLWNGPCVFCMIVRKSRHGLASPLCADA